MDHIRNLLTVTVNFNGIARKCATNERWRDFSDLSWSEGRSNALTWAVSVDQSDSIYPSITFFIEHAYETFDGRFGNRVSIVHKVVTNADIDAWNVILCAGFQEI